MKRYKHKFIWQNLIYSYLTIALLLGLIFVTGRGIFHLYKKYQITKLDKEYVGVEVFKTEEIYNENLEKLENIKTEEGKERFIRETYPVKKEGETVVVVYDVPSFTYEIPKKKSNWNTIKDFFFNLFITDKS